MNIENVISGFVGSIIGIIISGGFGRLTTAIKLNNYRNLILTYSNFILLKQTENYILDFEKAKYYATNYMEIAYGNLEFETKYNAMPMLTNDIFKSIPNEYLFKVFLSKGYLYSNFIDIFYSIDFLKNNMPSNKISRFHEQIKEHLAYMKIEPINAVAHLRRCSTLNNHISNLIVDSDYKIERAKGIIKEFKEINSYLKGSNIYWIINYFLRQ
ncbi:hypothetical protein PG291_07745 [Riemerella anatipestifer]|nr:hypothetical protein [Riemerella anatipestifer]